MRRLFGRLALAALAASAPATANAETQARILETQPAAGATLGRNQAFYVRIGYSTDEPVSLWARPYLRGREVGKAMSNASTRHTGAGEALG